MRRLCVGGLLTCALALTCSAAMADVRLTGTVGARTIDDNVIIPQNSACTLNGTIIKGNVWVASGARLVANGARIIGNVQSYGGRLIHLREQTYVNGDVQGERTYSVIVNSGTGVGGNVQIKEATAPTDVDALLVYTSSVDGDVQAEKSYGRLRVIQSTVRGNLQFVENRSGPYVIRDNRIGEDLQFFKNRGTGTITGNRVGGNLQSKENSPRPTVRYNIVDGDLEVE
jgi:hypothetical protein